MKMKTVCAGYARASGSVVKCGKFIEERTLPEKEAGYYKALGVSHPVSHGMCKNCYRKQMEESAKWGKMVYQVTAYKQGQKYKVFDGIEAVNGNEAINRIEKEHFPAKVSLWVRDKHGKLIEVKWSGYDFVARQFNMFMS
jgi:hypothetical protein